jgi:predicted permease
VTRLAQDARFALRSLRSNPASTILSTLTLAIGVAATTAVFTVVDHAMLRPLPFRDPDRLVRVSEMMTRTGHVTLRLREAVWRELQGSRSIFESIEAYRTDQRVLTGRGEPRLIALAGISPGLMSTLGVLPRLGRLFTPEEHAGGNVVLISESLWSSHLGRSPDIVGRTIELNGVRHVVVGVIPRVMGFPYASVEAWLPLGPSTSPLPMIQAVARLRPGVPIERARADLLTLSPALHTAGVLPRSVAPVVIPLATLGEYRRVPLLMLLGAVALVLAIACVNVANISLARAILRRRDLAVQAALGATGAQLARQVLLEGATIAVIGGAFGTLLAYGAVTSLERLAPRVILPVFTTGISLDGRALAFALSVSAATALLSSVVPGFSVFLRSAGIEDLKGGAAGLTTGPRYGRLRGLLVVAQCALAIVLLAAAGLFIRSFLRLQAVDPGFEPRDLLAVELVMPAAMKGDARVQLAAMGRIAASVRELPGVGSVAFAGAVPPAGTWMAAPIETDSGQITDAVWLALTPISPDYFRTTSIRILEGRAIHDDDPPSATIVSERFAKRIWPGVSAVGQRFRLPNEDWNVVIGVVSNVRLSSSPGEQEGFEFYYPFAREPSPWETYALFVRSAIDPAALIPMVKERIWSEDPRLPVTEAASMRVWLSDAIEAPRFYFVLMSLFAAIAAALAAVGIYGVVAFTVAQRTRELAIRAALGATPRRILQLVLANGMRLACVGVLIGLAGALAATRLLRGLLFQVSPHDAVTLAAVPACLLILALAGCYLPACRATRIDPLTALRAE